MTLDPTSGRRAENRVRTQRELSRAAFEIVRDHGIEALTADAVADRAGVSRRTFFNYFPRVELVLRDTVNGTLSRLTERLQARPPGESFQLSLLAVLDEPFEDATLEQAAVMFRQARTSPAARRFMLDATEELVDVVAASLRGRLGPGADPYAVRVLARTLIAAGRSAIEEWVERTDGVLDDETRTLQLTLLRQAFLHLHTTFGGPPFR